MVSRNDISARFAFPVDERGVYTRRIVALVHKEVRFIVPENRDATEQAGIEYCALDSRKGEFIAELEEFRKNIGVGGGWKVQWIEVADHNGRQLRRWDNA